MKKIKSLIPYKWVISTLKIVLSTLKKVKSLIPYIWVIGTLMIVLSTFLFGVNISKLDNEIRQAQDTLDNLTVEYYEARDDLTKHELKNINAQNFIFELNTYKYKANKDVNEYNYLLQHTVAIVLDNLIALIPFDSTLVDMNRLANMNLNQLNSEQLNLIKYKDKYFSDLFSKIKECKTNINTLSNKKQKRYSLSIYLQVFGLLLVSVSEFKKHKPSE
jgi:hypothetical protein